MSQNSRSCSCRRSRGRGSGQDRNRERNGRITGYATSIGFFAHAVSETNEDMMALIAAASEISGLGILVPTRNHRLFSWCLENNLQLVHLMTHMSIGLYNEPTGVYLPS